MPAPISFRRRRCGGIFHSCPRAIRPCRDKAELEAMKTRDPQAIAARRLLERGVEQHRLDPIRAEEAEAMERAVEHALSAAKPGPERIFEGLLSAGDVA